MKQSRPRRLLRHVLFASAIFDVTHAVRGNPESVGMGLAFAPKPSGGPENQLWCSSEHRSKRVVNLNPGCARLLLQFVPRVCLGVVVINQAQQ